LSRCRDRAAGDQSKGADGAGETHPTTALASARLKLEVLAEGVRVDAGAEPHVAANGKPLLRVRSGSCGGLDIVLSGDVWVNAPVHELFAARSPLRLRHGSAGLVLEDERDETVSPVVLPPAPAYYQHETSSGLRMSAVGQLCSDRLGVGLTNGCVYWGPRETRCRFCSIGLNVRTGHEEASKAPHDVLEVVAAAVHDEVAPATHLLLGGGTPPGRDAGGFAFADLTCQVKARFPNLPVYVMIAPPEDLSAVDALVDAGVDEIGINLELASAEARDLFMPAKAGIGRDRWERALGRAVELMGPRRRVGAVRSILIVGLEEELHTLQGVDDLAAAGVMPILTPFRPMRGTALEEHRRWPGDRLWDLCLQATSTAARHGLPLGPTCTPCQANTLNVPGHPEYSDT
jgi:hypothetical protein